MASKKLTLEQQFERNIGAIVRCGVTSVSATIMMCAAREVPALAASIGNHLAPFVAPVLIGIIALQGFGALGALMENIRIAPHLPRPGGAAPTGPGVR